MLPRLAVMLYVGLHLCLSMCLIVCLAVYPSVSCIRLKKKKKKKKLYSTPNRQMYKLQYLTYQIYNLSNYVRTYIDIMCINIHRRYKKMININNVHLGSVTSIKTILSLSWKPPEYQSMRLCLCACMCAYRYIYLISRLFICLN